MIRLIITVFLFLLGISSAQAHDFWIEPESFHTKGELPTLLRFFAGHHGNRQVWPLSQVRTVSFVHYSSSGKRDVSGGIIAHIRGSDPYALVNVTSPGTHMLAYESTEAVSDLPAKEFNDYAREEGLRLVMKVRKKNDTFNQAGHESYSRRSKVIIQTGAKIEDHVTLPIGQTLEIIPVKNPYKLKQEEALPMTVLFEGKPVNGAKIRLESLTHESEHKTFMAITDTAGAAEFNFPKIGAWRFNVVWSIPINDKNGTEFKTIFSSMTFGYDVVKGAQSELGEKYN